MRTGHINRKNGRICDKKQEVLVISKELFLLKNLCMEEVNEIFSSPKFNTLVLLSLKKHNILTQFGSGFFKNKAHTKR